MKNVSFLVGPMRLPFLILTPACVLLGLGTAVWTSGKVNGWYFVIVLIGALAAHISVNAFNEYFDFKSQLDFRTQRTPFSGGSGTLPANPEASGWALGTAVASLAIVGLVGIYFVLVRGWLLLPLGLLGMLVILAYTPWFTRSPVLSLISPGLGFGTLMVMGTNFCLTGHYSRTALIASMVPFFLVNDLLLLNQFPDAEPDRTINRRHLPILYGNPASAWVYGAFLLLAYVSIVVGILTGLLPVAALLGLGTLPLAVAAFRGARQNAENVGKLIPSMAQNVLVNVLTPVLVAVGLFIG